MAGGIGVDGTNRSGRPFTMRSENRALMLRSVSVSVVAMEERRARSWTLRSEFAMFWSDRRSTTPRYRIRTSEEKVRTDSFVLDFSSSSDCFSVLTSASSAEPGKRGGRYPTSGSSFVSLLFGGWYPLLYQTKHAGIRRRRDIARIRSRGRIRSLLLVNWAVSIDRMLAVNSVRVVDRGRFLVSILSTVQVRE